MKAGLRGDSVTVELAAGDGRGEATDVVRRVEGATETTLDGAHLRTRVPNGAEAVPAILSALESHGIAVASVTTARPSLDDVYLHYTGRDFTSEDMAGSTAGARPENLRGRA